MQIEAITPNVGAEVRDVRLSEIGSQEVVALKAALCERKVLVFRAQDLSAAQYAVFCQHFGTAVREDLEPGSDRPAEIGLIHIRANERQTINFWHMDHSFRVSPSAYISLYARKLPPCGGDTLFASLEAAYEGLDDETKSTIATLHAEHGYTETQNSRRRYTEQEIEARSKAGPIPHPLVCTNTENGRPYLFVNTPVYCRRIAEPGTDEDGQLLNRLYRHVQRPEFHFRLTWTPGTVVFWENAHCLHYPVADYYPHERLLWRVVIPGACHAPQPFAPAAGQPTALT